MSDYERYGDYDDREDDIPRRHGIVFRLLKFCVLLVLLSVCGTIVLRLIVSGYYPREIKRFYETDALAHYAAQVGDYRVEELSLKVPYDSSDFASFYADNAYLVEEAGAIQMSIRYTASSFETLAERLSLSEVPNAEDVRFDFTLCDNRGVRYTPSHSISDKYFWYYAVKLCFDSVDLVGMLEDEENDVDWLRLEIRVCLSGQEPDHGEEPYATIPVYGEFQQI